MRQEGERVHEELALYAPPLGTWRKPLGPVVRVRGRVIEFGPRTSLWRYGIVMGVGLAFGITLCTIIASSLAGSLAQHPGIAIGGFIVMTIAGIAGLAGVVGAPLASWFITKSRGPAMVIDTAEGTVRFPYVDVELAREALRCIHLVEGHYCLLRSHRRVTQVTAEVEHEGGVRYIVLARPGGWRGGWRGRWLEPRIAKGLGVRVHVVRAEKAVHIGGYAIV